MNNFLMYLVALILQPKKFDKAEVKSLVGQYFKTQEDPYYAEMFLPLFFNPDAFSQNFHEGIYDAILLNAQRGWLWIRAL